MSGSATVMDRRGWVSGGHTIRQYCDRGAILAGGRLQLFDDLASAFERYRRLLLEPSA
jgi:ABC-type polysaccharide/polyol phosphate transport system ATPase subunit